MTAVIMVNRQHPILQDPFRDKFALCAAGLGIFMVVAFVLRNVVGTLLIQLTTLVFVARCQQIIKQV